MTRRTGSRNRCASGLASKTVCCCRRRLERLDDLRWLSRVARGVAMPTFVQGGGTCRNTRCTIAIAIVAIAAITAAADRRTAVHIRRARGTCRIGMDDMNERNLVGRVRIRQEVRALRRRRRVRSGQAPHGRARPRAASARASDAVRCQTRRQCHAAACAASRSSRESTSLAAISVSVHATLFAFAPKKRCKLWGFVS